MSVVNPRRSYRSPRREEQAARTRLEIVEAAGRLFRKRGYAATSMPQVAAEAGVVVETVYRAFGSKAALFRAVMEALLAGGPTRAGVSVEERPAIKAVIEEPDPRRQVERYVATQPGIHRRSGPLLRALRGSVDTDPELAALWDEMEAWRLHGQGRFVTMLADRGSLRPGLDPDEARDIVWTLCSLMVHDSLVVERGWSSERYQAWLASMLIDQLLPPELLPPEPG